MAELTREEEFQGVVRLLRRPKEQRPGPDLILSALIRQEQSMLNDQNASGAGWTEEVTSFASVVGQAEYVITPAATTHSFGKALYVYRDLGSYNIMPVPFTDFQHEINNQSHEFWNHPFGTASWPEFQTEKIAFFRDSAGVKARIFPIPDEVKTYYVKYAVGRLDWTQFTWSDVPYLPEWSYLRQLKAAAFLLPDAEWEGYTRDENRVRRGEIATAIQVEVAEELPKYRSFLKNPQNEPISEIGFWYD